MTNINLSGVSQNLSLVQRLDQAAKIFGIDQPQENIENSILFKAARAIEALEYLTQVLSSDHASITFSNGDQLTLDRELTHFAGYAPAVLWIITYGERVEGNYGDDEATPGAHHFMATNTEYFDAHHGLVAVQALVQRAKSDRPASESGLGRPLSELLQARDYKEQV